MSVILKDDDEMPFGIHKGKTMENVPPQYLIWLLENNKCGSNNGVKEYIEDNMDVLNEEIKRKTK